MNSFKQEKQDESLESESAVIPSFRQLLFPMDPVTAANVHISPLSPRLQKDAQKSKRNQNSSQSSIKPRVKTRYELWREGRYKESFKPSLSGILSTPTTYLRFTSRKGLPKGIAEIFNWRIQHWIQPHHLCPQQHWIQNFRRDGGRAWSSPG